MLNLTESVVAEDQDGDFVVFVDDCDDLDMNRLPEQVAVEGRRFERKKINTHGAIYRSAEGITLFILY